jgi:hypothetical protein
MTIFLRQKYNEFHEFNSFYDCYNLIMENAHIKFNNSKVILILVSSE